MKVNVLTFVVTTLFILVPTAFFAYNIRKNCKSK